MSENVEMNVDNILDDLESSIKNATNLVQKKKDEAVVTTTLGLIISTPFLLKLFGKSLKAALKFIRNNKNDESKVANYIIEFSEKMHHALEKPFRLLAKTFTKDTKKQKIFAEVMLTGILVILLVDSGLSASKYLAKLNVKKSLFYTIKSAVKGTEVSSMLNGLVRVAKEVFSKV